jgi:hypothetical protein
MGFFALTAVRRAIRRDGLRGRAPGRGGGRVAAESRLTGAKA